MHKYKNLSESSTIYNRKKLFYVFETSFIKTCEKYYNYFNLI